MPRFLRPLLHLRRLTGVRDDPLEDIRRSVRWAVGIGGLALALSLA